MSNTLRLEDDAIERCVGICNAMVEQVDQAIKNADQLRFVSGFGGFDSAQQLQARYDEKFNGGDGSGSVRARLNEFRLVIETMRDTFAAGGEAFAETDSAIGRALAGIQGEIAL
ncbi:MULTISPECIES: hypothetical protein [Rhodococcus]|jgi:nucleoid DNA-binding protein|uniref:Uncharacterized protein n=2 Tax=Rhodococcus oxybenzonivorans TaxID=1990687 RepID=A0AAE5A9S2_9NOCA|nr:MULTISPECIES: hypothetical protein [Rhodococcus]MDV7241333.1 hypothetical protein [Rhodococcus oxybenzonivorans]MDV7269137.1 hypothetical protein [Rhodococcus oxybenzonivorans]MDV7274134.1 hypothetical protein [Rhodococcus oxybenzonivorans]MDV7333613.1 hypothetical protein [Rhodococcus oxybenzonivorans]MDV7343033.1 hypothetical protein [Rhodococcus oxybenzonivorans]